MSQTNDDAFNRYVGGGLRLARIVRGLSVTELAGSTGIAAQRLGRLEQGEEECTARELFTLAERLGVPVDYFFDGAATLSDVPSAPPLRLDVALMA
jgi:transcriptional regulator with XRE-family HTH domain